MKVKTYIVLIVLMLVSQVVVSQTVGTLSGVVRDASTNEILIGVTIYVESLKQGTSTDRDGKYSLKLAPGQYNIKYSFVGYETQQQTETIKAGANLRQNIKMRPDVAMLSEVVVSGEKANRNVSEMSMSIQTLDMITIKKIPALMGEVDVIKTIQLLPGVQAASEGSSGFSVRGGGTDQNLILLDDAPIYNASHFLGFFSVFNNDVVKDATLLKGDMPASYGGRLSSVLDVKVKEEVPAKLTGSGGVGLITSRLALQAPLFQHKTSLLLAARTTYAGLVIPFLGEKLRESNIYFYDLNAKITHEINANNRIYLSAYHGNDAFLMSKQMGVGYGNTSYTARWNHVFNERIASDLSLIQSNYRMYLDIFFDPYDFTVSSQLQDVSAKYNVTALWNENHTSHFGVTATFHNFGQGALNDRGGAVSQYLGLDRSVEVSRKSLEYGLYFSHEQKIDMRWSLRYGLRLSAFQNIGKEDFYLFDNNYNVYDTLHYAQGEIFHTEFQPEPRLALMYRLDEQSSIKASFSRTVQYLQVASNATGGLPFEVWFPSSPNVKPQTCGQMAMGYFRNFNNDAIESSFEVYYKTLNHIVDFKDAAQTYANLLIDGELREGKGRSFGFEMLLRKNIGQVTGWISYTYARSYRTVDDINFGKEYRSPYDRPHNFVAVLNYDITDRLNIAANWIFNTGQPVTYPYGQYSIGNVTYAIYNGTRNESRYPSYHRLDVSMTLKTKAKPWKKWESEWNISVYNAYAHKNTWAVTFEQGEDGTIITNKMYLFSAIPSLSYNFKF